AVLLVAPQTFIFGVALAVVIEDPVGALPVVLVTGKFLPARQIDAGVERPESLVKVGNLFRIRIGRRQLANFDIPEVTLGTFRFEAEVALSGAAFVAPRDFLAVDRQFHNPVLALDAVMVPLGGGFAAAFAGETAHPAGRMRNEGLHRRPV